MFLLVDINIKRKSTENKMYELWFHLVSTEWRATCAPGKHSVVTKSVLEHKAVTRFSFSITLLRVVIMYFPLTEFNFSATVFYAVNHCVLSSLIFNLFCFVIKLTLHTKSPSHVIYCKLVGTSWF